MVGVGSLRAVSAAPPALHCWGSAWLADPVAERGEILVRTNCSPCHTVGLTVRSPHPAAPVFRTLSERYPIEDLAETPAEGISTGRPAMPEFIATPDQIDAIIA